MGFLASATSVYATAYLTEIGRNYLFNNNNIRFTPSGVDLFQITSFALSDADTNYNVSNILEEGQVPDASGNGGQCLKTAANSTQTTLLYYQVSALSFTSAVYDTSLASTSETLTINTNSAGAFPLNVATDVPPTIQTANTTGGGGTLNTNTNTVPGGASFHP